MNVTTREQKERLREILMAPEKRTLKKVSELTGLTTATVGFYKGKWGLSKKRRARRSKKEYLKIDQGVKTDKPTTLSAFKAAYDQSSVVHKALLLQTIGEWVKEETVKLNGLK